MKWTSLVIIMAALSVIVTIVIIVQTRKREESTVQAPAPSERLVQKIWRNETNVTIGDASFLRVSQVRSIDYRVVVNEFTYRYEIDDSQNTKPSANVCMVFETEYDEAFCHWVFESAIHLYAFQALKQQYPSAKLLIRSKRRYKELFLHRFQLTYDDVLFDLPSDNMCFFCPLYSLNDLSIDVTKFTPLFRQLFAGLMAQVENVPIAVPVLYLPRSKVENFAPNDRTIVSADQIRSWCSANGGVNLDVHEITDFREQIRVVKTAKSVVLDYGASFFVNGLLAANGSRLIVLGNMHQHTKYPAMTAIMTEILKKCSVAFVNPSADSASDQLVFKVEEINAEFKGSAVVAHETFRNTDYAKSYPVEIFTYGDSHCKFTFENIPEIPMRMHWLGPVLMHRIGRDGIHLGKLTSDHPHIVLLFVFGEIDIRCQVGKQVEKGRDAQEVLFTLAERYVQSLNRAVQYHPNIPRAIMSVVPPSTADPAYLNQDFPFIGSDEQRSDWTMELNAMLRRLSEQHGYYFLDIYTDHADEKGMLIRSYSDGNVHIKQSPFVQQRVQKMLSELIKC